MQEVGEVMHLANSGRVIVRLTNTVGQNHILCDDRGVKIARVTELIGPVAKPYASAISLTNNIKKFVGKKVFVLETTSAKKFKKQRRKQK